MIKEKNIMNERIQQAMELTKDTLLNYKMQGKTVSCSVSGGADSDILIDLCERLVPHYVNYVFFDTGIEYQATKNHLEFLEKKYNITIHKEKAKIPVPLGNKRYGIPFLSKQVSEYIHRLQIHNFDWNLLTYEENLQRYPKCKTALRWWCNAAGEKSAFNINRNVWLKEFLVKNPPTFPISPRCCEGAKKNPNKNYMKTHTHSLSIVGIRQAEQGARTFVHKGQFQEEEHYTAFYPIYYFTDADRKIYENEFDIVHSQCYTEYGLKRTGCAGCPFGREYNFEREVIKMYEPKLHKAIENMWSEVYEYTNKYKEFQRVQNLKYKSKKMCTCGCTEFTGDDVAMNLKYFGRDVNTLLCRNCFQNKMKMTDEQWDAAIEGFKAQGCQLF